MCVFGLTRFKPVQACLYTKHVEGYSLCLMSVHLPAHLLTFALTFCVHVSKTSFYPNPWFGLFFTSYEDRFIFYSMYIYMAKT